MKTTCTFEWCVVHGLVRNRNDVRHQETISWYFEMRIDLNKIWEMSVCLFALLNSTNSQVLTWVGRGGISYYKIIISLYACESGWEPHWQGASIYNTELRKSAIYDFSDITTDFSELAYLILTDHANYIPWSTGPDQGFLSSCFEHFTLLALLLFHHKQLACSASSVKCLRVSKASGNIGKIEYYPGSGNFQ